MLKNNSKVEYARPQEQIARLRQESDESSAFK